MSKEVKLIFGVETTTTTTVNIEATIDHDAPILTVITRNAAGDQVAYNDGKWTASLAAGQHVLVIEVTTEDEWFEDEPSFELSQNGKIVVHLSGSSSTAHTQVWQADSGEAADPKDPWPPPGSAVTLSDATWFASTLSGWYADINNPRGDGRVLDAPLRFAPSERRQSCPRK